MPNANRIKSSTVWVGILYLVHLQGSFHCVQSWHDDLFYFTSFKDVKEWGQVYQQCNITHDYANQKILKVGLIPHTISPIALPDPRDVEQVDRRDESQVLLIYNNPPPATGDYTVSYGFQRNKECVENNFWKQCYTTPSFGRIRGVVLNAERVPLIQIKSAFTVEEPEKFVTILNGGSRNERKFYEALFLGNPKGSTAERSTHTIEGKSYPMEIYMYFVDEAYPAMSSTTILVVLVEEVEEDNPSVKPLVNAVSFHLYGRERKFLKTHETAIQQEKMYHHLPESQHKFRFIPRRPETFDHQLDSSWKIEQTEVSTLEYWEKSRTLYTEQALLLEDLKQVDQKLKDLKMQQDEGHNDPDMITSTFLKYYDTVTGASEYENMTYPGRSPEVANVLREYVRKVKELDDARYNPKKNATKDLVIYLRELENNLTFYITRIYIEYEKLIQRKIPDKVKRLVNLHDRYRWVENIKGYTKANETLIKQLQKSNINQGWTLTTQQTQELHDKVAASLVNIIHFNPAADSDPKAPPRIQHQYYKRTGSIREGNMGMTQKEYEDHEKLQHIKVKLRQKFQVSWLIPDGGGYYIYTGSSPVPPCFKAEKVIVFRKPIKMSKEQIEGLTTLPMNFNKKTDIRNTLPPLQRLRRPDFPIYFEKRNHQFLGEDGVHKNSVFEAARRRASCANLHGLQVPVVLAAVLTLISTV